MNLLPLAAPTRRAVLGLAGVIALPALAAAPAPVPVERWGRLPALGHVALSPSARRLAYVRQTGDERTLSVFSLVDKKPVTAVRLGQTKVRQLEWADEDRLLIASSSTQALPLLGVAAAHEWLLLQLLDLSTGKLREVLPAGAVRGVTSMNVLAALPQVRRLAGRTWLYLEGIHVTRRAERMLVRVAAAGGDPEIVRLGDEDTRGWRVDVQGQVLAEEQYDDRNRRWSLRLRRPGDRYEEVLAREVAEDLPQLGGLDPTGRALLLRENPAEDSVWRPVDLQQGTLGPVIEPFRGYRQLLHDPQSLRMTAGVSRNDIRSYSFVDKALQTRWDGLLETLGERHVELVSSTEGHAQVVVLVHGHQQPHAYLMFDLLADEGLPIGDCYPGTPLPHPVRRSDYLAGDGLPIPAYLTLPRGLPERALPLVVLPHGGPQTADTMDFDWWSQALADQGYAVLRPNYRGSALGAEFVARGHGQWGRKMQSDLSDGVQHHVARGWVDAKRVAIVGGSYGGYAALAGATMQPQVYRCAVAVAGPADLQAMLAWVDNKRQHANALASRYWRRFMGASGRYDPALIEISPSRRVTEATPPVLLIHGEDDTVVPYEQSEIMARALRQAGRPVTQLALEGEDHWLSRNDTRVKMLQATVAFLRQHNPPD